jgi:GNAT superfamily N-acetyltransferase
LATAYVRYRHEAEHADAEKIRAIVQSSGFFNPEEVEVAVELVLERLEKGEKSGYYFLFAETEGRMAGYACYGPIAGTQCSFDLYWIAVDNGRRGGGIGSALLEKAEEKILGMGGGRIYVETSSRDQYEPTRAFYLRNGYRLEADLKDFYAPGDSKVLFVKEL